MRTTRDTYTSFGGAPGFTTTEWSVVLSASDGASGHARAALEELCRKYWYPLYVFVRRRGSDPFEAADLTQAFFGFLLQKEGLNYGGQIN